MQKLTMIMIGVAAAMTLGCGSSGGGGGGPAQTATDTVQPANDTKPQTPIIGADTKQQQACTPSATQCEGQKLMTCKADGKSWASFTCPNGCLNGQCQQGCQGMTPVCVNSKDLQYCENTGKVVVTKTCTKECQAGVCVEEPVICQAGTTRCAPNAPTFVETCKNDGTGWVTAPTPCQNQCQNGQCVNGQLCTAGESFCQNTVLFTCDPNGKSWIKTDCPGGCIPTDGTHKCKGDCPVGYQECVNTKILKSCDELGFYKTKTCQGTCADGQCSEDVPLCNPNQNFCEAGGGHIMLCAATGKTATALEACPFGCDPQTVKCKTAACIPGEKQCSPQNPKYVMACKPDQSGFQLAQNPCPFKCDNGQCVEPACQPGQAKCGAEGILVCKPDQSGYTVQTPCAEGCFIAGNGNPACGICKAGAKQCKDYTIQICQKPTMGWIDLDTCSIQETCSLGKCVDMVFLEGSNSKEENYVLVLSAMAECWQAKTADVCGGFQTQGISYAITADNLEAFVCDDPNAKSLFASDSLFESANDILGCGDSNVHDLTFEGDKSIKPNQDGKQCYAFCTGCNNLLQLDLNGKEILVAACDKFVP